MLTARKSLWIEKLFVVYNKNLIKRRFFSFNISGLDEITSRNTDIPLIIYANHSSWWDGFVSFEVSRSARLDYFIMMEEKQLKDLYLFRRLGAFSVNRNKAREALKSLDYAADLLKQNSNRVLWIFPQGEILPNDVRPLNFYNGLSRIIKIAGKVNVVPVAIRYEFRGEFKPEIFVKTGKVDTFGINDDFELKNQTRHFAQKLIGVLDELKVKIVHENFDEFVNII